MDARQIEEEHPQTGGTGRERGKNLAGDENFGRTAEEGAEYRNQRAQLNVKRNKNEKVILDKENTVLRKVLWLLRWFWTKR